MVLKIFKGKNMCKYFIFGEVNYEKDNLIYNFALQKSENSGLMSKLNNNLVIVNTQKGKVKVEILKTKINLDENFLSQLWVMVFRNVSYVAKIKTSSGLEKSAYFEKQPGTIKAMLYGLISRWDFNIEKIDVLDIAIDLMIRISRTQLIFNGNKRLAILSCSSFLKSVNLYLKWSNFQEYYLKYWEELINNIAKGKYGQDIDDIKNNNQIIFNYQKGSIRDIFINSLYLSNYWLDTENYDPCDFK